MRNISKQQQKHWYINERLQRFSIFPNFVLLSVNIVMVWIFLPGNLKHYVYVYAYLKIWYIYNIHIHFKTTKCIYFKNVNIPHDNLSLQRSREIKKNILSLENNVRTHASCGYTFCDFHFTKVQFVATTRARTHALSLPVRTHPNKFSTANSIYSALSLHTIFFFVRLQKKILVNIKEKRH